MKNKKNIMKIVKSVVSILSLSLLFACSAPKTLVVKNTLPAERCFETVELTKEKLHVKDLSLVGFRDVATKELQLTQLVDVDGDGVMDEILFQPKVAGNSEAKFDIVTLKEGEHIQADELCYSRFVPERTDDYTWENDRVAFRVYGPVAQELKEAGKKGGTLSSGVDAWLKKVSYPVINKWYKETLVDKTGSYHKDTGEGLDNFHVGVSRGVGGLAVKSDGNFYYSKNYIKWRTITTGPLRTSFYLEYQNWNAGGKLITESKVISLDLGNNFSKFETSMSGTDDIFVGLTLHEKDGVVTGNIEKGWVSYWQPHADSELGTSIVADKNTFLDYEKYDVKEKDLSNAYANLKVSEDKVVYYAGFAWKESKQYPTKESWEAYLNLFSDKINNPLQVELK